MGLLVGAAGLMWGTWLPGPGPGGGLRFALPPGGIRAVGSRGASAPAACGDFGVGGDRVQYFPRSERPYLTPEALAHGPLFPAVLQRANPAVLRSGVWMLRDFVYQYFRGAQSPAGGVAGPGRLCFPRLLLDWETASLK